MNLFPEETLANQIVKVAAKDYKRALIRARKADAIMQRKPFNPKTYYPAEEVRWRARGTIKECEQFFRGDLFPRLTSLDGEWLIEKIRQEAHAS